MRAVLETRWSVCAETWGEAAGYDPADCAVEMAICLSNSLLPDDDEHPLIAAGGWTYDRHDPPLAPTASGLVRFRLTVALEVEAARWREQRGLGRRADARRDLVRWAAVELWTYWMVQETRRCWMAVAAPYPMLFTPAMRRCKELGPEPLWEASRWRDRRVVAG